MGLQGMLGREGGFVTVAAGVLQTAEGDLRQVVSMNSNASNAAKSFVGRVAGLFGQWAYNHVPLFQTGAAYASRVARQAARDYEDDGALLLLGLS
jgi:hypothetical protein